MAREERDLPPTLHGDAAIAVEFNPKVHFSSVGSAVTGLHRIGSMNTGSMRFRIVWSFVVFASAYSISLGEPNRKGQIHVFDFRAPFVTLRP
jgi:hypothetical protein